MGENKGHTTVAVDIATAEKLEDLAKAANVSKKVFMAIAIDYFERNGINPKSHESPKSELEAIRKRINDVIGFIKKNEQNVLNPLREKINDVAKETGTCKGELDSQKKVLYDIKSKLKELEENLESLNTNYSTLKTNVTNLNTGITSLNTKIDKQNKDLEKLLSYLDGKNKSGLIGKIFQ